MDTIPASPSLSPLQLSFVVYELSTPKLEQLTRLKHVWLPDAKD
jgi:hypothetical protein